LGTNGAGKSTLVKILSGAEGPSAGQSLLEGRPLSFDSPTAVHEQGVATVYRDLALTPTENLFLGHELGSDERESAIKPNPMTEVILMRPFVLVAILAVALTAHSAGAAPNKSVALVLGVKGSPFYDALACGAKAKAESLGYALTVSAPDQFDPTAQTPVVDAVGAAMPAAAAIVPTDGQALRRPIKNLADRGIKILTVDQTLVDPSFVQTQIVTDGVAGGVLAAKEMARLLAGKGKVFILAAPPGLKAEDDRVTGFVAEIKNTPDVKVVGTDYVNDDPQKAAEIITSAISANPDLAGVFAFNDQAAIGAITGLKQAGATGKIKLVAYDAATAEVNALRNGAIAALIAQDPKQEGELAIELSDKALKGETLPKVILSELVVVRTGDAAAANRYEYKADCTP
jgi:ribose transport system substrate-binding protein